MSVSVFVVVVYLMSVFVVVVYLMSVFVVVVDLMSMFVVVKCVYWFRDGYLIEYLQILFVSIFFVLEARFITPHSPRVNTLKNAPPG